MRCAFVLRGRHAQSVLGLTLSFPALSGGHRLALVSLPQRHTMILASGLESAIERRQHGPATYRHVKIQRVPALQVVPRGKGNDRADVSWSELNVLRKMIEKQCRRRQ